jgi:hypothetical protein
MGGSRLAALLGRFGLSAVIFEETRIRHRISASRAYSIRGGLLTAMIRCRYQELDLAECHAVATAVCHCAAASAHCRQTGLRRLGTDGSQTPRRRGTDSNRRSLPQDASVYLAERSGAKTSRGAVPQGWSIVAGPRVRIHLPPAESLSLAPSRSRTWRTPAFRAGVRGWLGDWVGRDAQVVSIPQQPAAISLSGHIPVPQCR